MSSPTAATTTAATSTATTITATTTGVVVLIVDYVVFLCNLTGVAPKRFVRILFNRRSVVHGKIFHHELHHQRHRH